MSKAYERALGIEEPEEAETPPAHPSPCWRCRKGYSRLIGIDATCDDCFAFIEGTSDVDPREPILTNEYRAGAAYAHGMAQSRETTS